MTKFSFIFTLVCASLLFGGCNGQIDTDFAPGALKNKDGGGSSETSSEVQGFAGIDSVSDISFTTATLNWTTHASAVAYDIFNSTSGSVVYVATVGSGVTTYAITGLSDSTTYKYLVKAKDQYGVNDSNTNETSFSTTSVVVGWNLFWSSGFENSFNQDGGFASSGDVVVNQNSGSFQTARVNTGSYSYYCNSVSTASNRLRLLINDNIIYNWDGFKIEFYVNRASADNFPTLVAVGTNSTLGNGAGQNYIGMRWPHGTYGHLMRQNAGASTYGSNTAWFAGNNVWQKIELVYRKNSQQGEFWIDGVLKQTGAMDSTFADAGSNQLAFSLCQWPYQANSDNGVAAYFDDFKIYTLKE